MNTSVSPPQFRLEDHLPPWACCFPTLVPNPLDAVVDIEKTLFNSLEKPIGLAAPIVTGFRPGETVAIVVPDASRKAGLHLLLPGLVRYLAERGITESSVSFFFAVGVHRPPSEEEQARILGPDLYENFRERCFNHDAHDAENLMYAGCTSRGTKVYLNRRACECSHLILTGSVVPHYFAGFGGGRKALVPGMAGAETIAHNHALNLHPVEPCLNPTVRICAMTGNPVAEDLLEAACLHPPDFIINTVMTSDGEIGGLFVGEMDEAHRAACDLAARTYCIPVRGQADLVIASVQAAPDFIQSHKALVNAFAALQPEGLAVLYAPSPEGLGGKNYRRYLELGDPAVVIAALRRQADINGQTALSTLQKGSRTILVTSMPEKEVRLLGAEKAPSLEVALNRAKERLHARNIPTPRGYIMPQAGLTVPLLGE